MSTMPLPAKASLSQLRARAKELRKAVAKGRPDAVERARAHHPAYDEDGFTLRDAQLTIAREYGLASWPELMQKVATELVEGRELHRYFRVEMGDWDEPFAREAMARALAATGEPAAARAELDRVRELAAHIARAGDRQVLAEELAKQPWFGLTT